MRFETSNSIPPHQNRRLQLRMLGFVALIGVIMFVMSTLQPKQQNAKNNRPFPGSPEPGVFKVEDPDRPSLGDGEFFSQPENQIADPQRGWKEPSVDGQESPAQARDEMDREIAILETKFDKGILRRVKDNTLGIRREESDAYFRLLNHARRVPVAELETAGATDVLYINLMTEPDRYRGDAITIQGELWRLYEFQAGPNDWGLETLYEAWIFTSDSDKHPYRVVLTRLPRELEPGINLRKPVRVTGYFFKREGYASNGGMHVAPTLLARRVVPYRSPDAAPSTDAILPYMLGLISAVGLAFLVTLVSFAISDRRAARAAMLRELNAPRPSFEGIDAPPLVSVAESLRLLEEQEWHEATECKPEEDASAALHARDPLPARTDHRSATSDPTEAELTKRRRDQIRSVKNWTSHQQASAAGNHASDEMRNRDRERRNIDQVLDRPAPDSESSAQPLADVDTTADSVNGSERISESPVVGNGLSKLAAWQNEIQQIAALGRDEQISDGQQAAQAELQRDQAARDRELHDRLLHQRTELDDERTSREIRERELEQSRQQELNRLREIAEREAKSLEQLHQAGSPSSEDHLVIDRADRDQDVAAEEIDEVDTNDEGEPGDASSSDWSRDQGRRRRRRR